MSTKSGGSLDFIMLTACGTPGSALALHESVVVPAKELLQSSESAGAAVPEVAGDPHQTGVRAWIGRVLSPLFASSWEQEIREREGYLAQAQNPADLEARMRTVDGMAILRGSALS